MKPISKFLLAGFLLVIFVAVLESCQKEEPIVEQTQVENLTVYQDGSGVQFTESGFLQLTRADQSTICSDPNSQQFVFYTNVDGDITYYHWNGNSLITLGENGEQFYNDKCNQWNRSPLNYVLTVFGDIPVPEQTCITGQTEFVCTYDTCYHYICVNETWVPQGNHSLEVTGGGWAEGLHAPCPTFPHPYQQDGSQIQSNDLTVSGDTPESVTTCTNPSNPNHTVTIIQRGMQCSAKETINGVTSNIPCFGEGGGLDKCSMWADGISQGLEDALNSSTRASGGWMHYCGQVQFRDVWLGGAQMRREFRWPDGNGGWVTSFDAQYVHSNLCE